MDKIAWLLYSVRTLHERLHKQTLIQFNYQLVLKMSSQVSLDLVEMKAYNYTNDLGTDIEEIEIPGDLQDLAEEWRTKLAEAVAETDEELMRLTWRWMIVPTLKAATVKQPLQRTFTQYSGSAFKNSNSINVDGVIDYLPSPLDVPDGSKDWPRYWRWRLNVMLTT